MNRGSKFEKKVGNALKRLCTQYPEYAEVSPQFSVALTSGRRADIDFKLLVRFAHENQSYYFELQSRNKHSHELVDKIEAVRRDTKVSTFSFIHESPLELSVAKELAARNVICYDWDRFSRFLSGIELQLLQLRRAQQEARGEVRSSDSRLQGLVKKLADTEEQKSTRELTGSMMKDGKKDAVVKEILEEVARDPAEAIRQARKIFNF